jgi:hypothetical protein
MRPGGTNLLDSRGLCRCSQAPYPYDAYPLRGSKRGFEPATRCAYPTGEGALQLRKPIAETYLRATRWANVMSGQRVQSTRGRARTEFEGKRNARGGAKSSPEKRP